MVFIVFCTLSQSEIWLGEEVAPKRWTTILYSCSCCWMSPLGHHRNLNGSGTCGETWPLHLPSGRLAPVWIWSGFQWDCWLSWDSATAGHIQWYALISNNAVKHHMYLVLSVDGTHHDVGCTKPICLVPVWSWTASLQSLCQSVLTWSCYNHHRIVCSSSVSFWCQVLVVVLHTGCSETSTLCYLKGGHFSHLDMVHKLLILSGRLLLFIMLFFRKVSLKLLLDIV